MASVPQLGEHAAEAIRELNHRTRDRGAIVEPTELCRLLADLATMASRLPQLLDQLDRRLRHEQDANRLRADNDTEPGELVCLIEAEPIRTGQRAHHLPATIDTAHQHVAHLASTA